MAAALIAATAVGAEPTVLRAPHASSWTATDALGRVLPTHADVGAPRADRFVAIFYCVWLGQHGGPEVYDLSKIFAANPQSPAYGPLGAFHWWAEPYFGYYRSDDAWVVRKHMQMLADAGVDAVVIDVTNGYTYDGPVGVLLQILGDMRAKGARTPRVAFLANAAHAAVVQKLYDTWYKPGNFDAHWFRWQGKPLVMANPEGVSPECRDAFTFRHSWAFSDEHHRTLWMGDGREKWPWIDNYPQGFGWRDAPDKPEEMPVAIATHPIAGVGRSHDGSHQPPEGQNDPARGTYFQKQWDRAIEADPELVFVTGWNEWVAQRFQWGDPPVNAIGYRKPGPGESFFVDQMSPEFSRDAEPMRGGFGDDYYYQLVANVRRFKGAAAPPASARKSIDVSGDFAQWSDVPYAYADDIGDCGHRNHPGCAAGVTYVETSGRNDIEEVRVAHDDASVCFYVQCVEPIQQPEGQSRLVLLIDADGDAASGFAGFELAVNRGLGDGKPRIERVVADFETAESLGAAASRLAANELQLAVPRELLERDGKLSFDFKWADNLPAASTPLDFIDKGDCAPNGRFAYRYASESAAGR